MEGGDSLRWCILHSCGFALSLAGCATRGERNAPDSSAHLKYSDRVQSAGAEPLLGAELDLLVMCFLCGAEGERIKWRVVFRSKTAG